MNDSPYNSKELARAKAVLISEVETGSLRLLRNRMSSSGSNSFPNVWEGEIGSMEHVIKDTFPMPWKSNSESETIDSSSKDQGSKSKNKKVDSYIGKVSTSKSSSIADSSSPTEEPPVSMSEPESGECNDDDDDCIILEQKKEVIEIEDDCESNDNSESDLSPNCVSNSELSKDETIVRQNLKELQKEIAVAKSSVSKIKKLFNHTTKDVTKGCEGMTSLRGQIDDLVKKLREIKDGIMRCQSSSLTQDVSNNNNCLVYSQVRYQNTWTLLSKLMGAFVWMRKTKKLPLVQLGKFEELSLKKPRKSMQKLRLKKPVASR